MPARKTTSRSKDDAGAGKESGAARSRGARKADNIREPIMEFASATSSVVQQAASILEEEIAAGIVAAKRVEKEFVDPEELRSGNPNDVTQRLRRDAHDAVDILLDVVEAAARAAGRAGEAAKEGAQERPKPRAARRGRAR